MTGNDRLAGGKLIGADERDDKLAVLTSEILNYNRMNQPVECIERMREVLNAEDDPAIRSICFLAIANQATSLGLISDAKEAIASYEGIRSTDDIDIYCDLIRSRIYVADQDFSHAREMLYFYLSMDKIRDIATEDIFYEMNELMGHVLKETGQYALAIEYFKVCIPYLSTLANGEVNDHRRIDALVDYGFCLDEVGGLNEAEATFQDIINSGSQYRLSDALYYLGIIYLKKSRPDSAIMLFRRALTSVVNDPDRTNTILMAEKQAHKMKNDSEYCSTRH